MTRADIAIAIAGALLVAFILGWLAHWLFARLTGTPAERLDRADEVTAELLAVEDERDRIASEAREAARNAAALLREREAELEAAMEGLGAARAEIEELRSRAG